MFLIFLCNNLRFSAQDTYNELTISKNTDKLQDYSNNLSITVGVVAIILFILRMLFFMFGVYKKVKNVEDIIPSNLSKIIVFGICCFASIYLMILIVCFSKKITYNAKSSDNTIKTFSKLIANLNFSENKDNIIYLPNLTLQFDENKLRNIKYNYEDRIIELKSEFFENLKNVETINDNEIYRKQICNLFIIKLKDGKIILITPDLEIKINLNIIESVKFLPYFNFIIKNENNRFTIYQDTKSFNY